MPLRDTLPALQLPAFSAGLPSSPFQQGLFTTAAPHQQQQQYGDAGWSREEYQLVAALRSAFAQSCIGSSTAAVDGPENLLGMAEFDLPPFEMLPATDRRPFRSSTKSKLFRQLDPLMLLADQSSSSDAVELPLPMLPQHQEQAHHHRLFVEATVNIPVKEAPGSSLQNQMESHLSARSCFGAPLKASHAGTSNRNAEPPTARPSKTRIRWTQDLHERFIECVNQLGGADKATPKKILKLMNSNGPITLYHIKSHLQKYRTAKCTPPPSSSPEGKQHEKWGGTQNLEPGTGMQITEALRVQLDVQRRLDEQLEMQSSLQVRIEEQVKRLEKMFEEQIKTSNNNAPLSLPDPDDVLFPAATAEQDDAVFADIVDTDEMQLMSVGSGSNVGDF